MDTLTELLTLADSIGALVEMTHDGGAGLLVAVVVGPGGGEAAGIDVIPPDGDEVAVVIPRQLAALQAWLEASKRAAAEAVAEG